MRRRGAVVRSSAQPFANGVAVSDGGPMAMSAGVRRRGVQLVAHQVGKVALRCTHEWLRAIREARRRIGTSVEQRPRRVAVAVREGKV